MRKIAAASAALLALVFGLVTWTVVAQNRDRSAEGAPVRASLVIRHVVQEGENLTTDDGRYGPGGIMQHYLGRRRSGDIGRLRAYDGNRRVIWVTRCEWPEDVPDEERTTLQECPDAYARYSIRRSVGRVIEIPLRWIPTPRLAELTRRTPGIARDMRRIAAVMNAPGTTMVSGDSGMANEDPVVDAPVASAAGTEPEGIPDAGVEIVAADVRDAGALLASGTGSTGGSGGTEHVGGEGGEVEASVMPLAWGVSGWGLAALLLLGCIVLVSTRRVEYVSVAAKEKPFDPETDPRTKKIRDDREEYRIANEGLEREKQTALTELTTARDERTAANRLKDDEQRDKNIAQNTLLKVADAFGLNPKNLFATDPERKLLVNVILDHLRQGAILIQKVADWTQPANPWEFALAGEAFNLKVRETRDMETLATRAIARVRRWGKRAIALKREIVGLNQGFSEHLEQSSAEYLAIVQEKDGLTRRVIQTEDQLRANDIEPFAWLPIAAAAEAAPTKEPAVRLPDAPLEKPRRNDEKTEVVFGIEAFARETEQLARSAEETQTQHEAEPDELEGAPTSAGFRLQDLSGASESDELPSELTRTGTTIQGMQAVKGEALGTEPLPGSETSPGVGLSDVAGAPRIVAAPTAVPSTIGYQALRTARGDEETTKVMVPPSDKLPADEEPDADDDEDVENDPHAIGSDDSWDLPSHTQPVMCGCGKKFLWDEWAAHAGKCPDADKVQVPSAPNAHLETDARSTRKKRRDKRRGSP